MGADALRVYGGESFQTPHIDRLAQRGVTFNNAYATPICTTTRAEVLTGLYPFHSGWDRVQNDMHWRKALAGLQADITIPKMLKRAGYVSGAFGKWHLANLE
jgi:arylsulfatase A-like enzyme